MPERFVSEPIETVVKTSDTMRMSLGEPGLPRLFVTKPCRPADISLLRNRMQGWTDYQLARQRWLSGNLFFVSPKSGSGRMGKALLKRRTASDHEKRVIRPVLLSCFGSKNAIA
jgi:hypothetical protein